MTSGQSYEGKGDSATQPQQNGSGIEPSVNPDQQAANQTPQAAISFAQPKFSPSQGSLTGSLSLSVNSRYGNSRTEVLLFALSEYRDHRLKQAFKDILDGEYENGFNAFQDSEEAATAILEIGLELGGLADKNYWATRGEPAKVADHDREGFERFMREYVGREATSLD